jgi:hypothetical protein
MLEVTRVQRISHSLPVSLFVLSLAAALVGCGPPGVQPVSGTVKFAGGGMPMAEVTAIRFEPIEGTTAAGQVKVAGGKIKPDGTYTLTTFKDGDGAYVGEYKVCFVINKTYVGQEPLIDKKYAKPETTPHTAKVTAGGANKFDFEVTPPGQ